MFAQNGVIFLLTLFQWLKMNRLKSNSLLEFKVLQSLFSYFSHDKRKHLVLVSNLDLVDDLDDISIYDNGSISDDSSDTEGSYFSSF